MPEQRIRIMLALIGDLKKDPFAAVKYGFFHDALETAFGSVDSYDATLRDVPRLVNAIQVFHPIPRVWRERFWKNVPAFKARSRKVANALRDRNPQPEFVLQMGVLFNASLYQSKVSSLVYTDYTASLSASRPESGRSPFTDRQRDIWLSMEKETYRSAKHVFTRSELVRASVIQDYGIEAEKVTVIGGGVNYACLPEPASRSGGEAPTVLFIGKEFHRKGGDLLLKAFSLARQEYPLAKLKLVTQMPDPINLPLENVDVIEPTWNRDVVSKLFQEADIFVLPSRLETWGDVLLEAMAWGLPCIGVQGDAMNEIILERKTGFLVQSGDVDSLSGRLLELFREPEKRMSYGRAGRQRVEELFTWDHVVARISSVLTKMRL